MSEESKRRNEEYEQRRKAEFNRRHSAGLLVITKHSGRDHWETQDEFLRWFKQTFDWTVDTLPRWWHGSRSKVNGQTHTWLVANEEQQIICKLRWG
jgi:hypothetical protein